MWLKAIMLLCACVVLSGCGQVTIIDVKDAKYFDEIFGFPKTNQQCAPPAEVNGKTVLINAASLTSMIPLYKSQGSAREPFVISILTDIVKKEWGAQPVREGGEYILRVEMDRIQMTLTGQREHVKGVYAYVELSKVSGEIIGTSYVEEFYFFGKARDPHSPFDSLLRNVNGYSYEGIYFH